MLAGLLRGDTHGSSNESKETSIPRSQSKNALNLLCALPYNEAQLFIHFKESAIKMAAAEELLAPMIDMIILSSSNFAESISKLLSNSFESNMISKKAWYDLFYATFNGSNGKYSGQCVICLMLRDLLAIAERDPACKCIVQAFLFFKGFKALQAHRASHILWHNNQRKQIALQIQSRNAELWAVDIHPNARIGGGLMIDHATGLVIGETAVVGNNCSFLHGVTLGSSGKDVGDRHPKIGDDVLIGCNAILLGNITIGRSSKIGSGSVVIKPVPEFTTAVGNPARIVGQNNEKSGSAAKEMDLSLSKVKSPSGTLFHETFTIWADGEVAFEDLDGGNKGYIDPQDLAKFFTVKLKLAALPSAECMNGIFPTFDADGDGKISKSDFDITFNILQPLLKQYNTTTKHANDPMATRIHKSYGGGILHHNVGLDLLSHSPSNSSLASYSQDQDVDFIVSSFVRKLARTDESMYAAYI